MKVKHKILASIIDLLIYEATDRKELTELIELLDDRRYNARIKRGMIRGDRHRLERKNQDG